MALQAEVKRVAEILNSMKVMGDFIITHGLFIKYVSNSFSKKIYVSNSSLGCFCRICFLKLKLIKIFTIYYMSKKRLNDK